MAEEQSKGIQQIEGCEVIYDMGSGLVIAKVPLDKVKEQDINARIMKNEMQDQLTANIKKRGQLESLPLFVLVDGKLEIISGHHSLRTNHYAMGQGTRIIAAGTYYIEIGTTWGDKGYCVAGKKYQFTLTKPVPAGGQLAGFRGAPDQAPSTWKVYSYNSKTAVDAIETVPVTEGSSGTSLGVLKFGGDGKLNCLQRTAYGYNRWSQSAMRQWLNSDKGVGEWWTPQNDYDRCPDQLATKAGFLTGFDADFLEILRPTKVVTALNTVTDSTSSNSVEPLETTYDKIYLPALEQMSIEPELAGEGPTWDYWKRASNMTTKMKKWQTYPQIRTFAIENHTSPQYVRLRSASRGNSCSAWCVNSSGYVSSYYHAVNAYRCAPACDFC